MKGCVAQVWCTGERKGEGPRRHASNWVAVELAPATHGCALGINISKSTAACSPLSNMYFWMVAACTSSITWELVKLGGRSFPCKRGTAPVRKQLQRRSAPPAIEIALLHGQRAGRCSNANLAADARVCDGVRRAAEPPERSPRPLTAPARGCSSCPRDTELTSAYVRPETCLPGALSAAPSTPRALWHEKHARSSMMRGLFGLSESLGAPPEAAHQVPSASPRRGSTVESAGEIHARHGDVYVGASELSYTRAVCVYIAQRWRTHPVPSRLHTAGNADIRNHLTLQRTRPGDESARQTTPDGHISTGIRPAMGPSGMAIVVIPAAVSQQHCD
eukprot:365750-Chlamydomonas_euryale.AAC.9